MKILSAFVMTIVIILSFVAVFSGQEDDEQDWRNDPVPFVPTYSKTLNNDPLLNFDKIVFVKRLTFHSSHFYTDFIDGCSRFGG